MAINPASGREMAAIQDVFGGDKSTPHAIFQKSRAENAGTVVHHRANDLALECPTCKNGVRLFAKNDVGYYCNNGHKWTDMEVLMSLNPAKLPFKGIVARQEGFVKFDFELPADAAKALKNKFGEKLPATLASMADLISQGRYLMLGDRDLERLDEKVGEKITSPAQLVGKVWDYKTTIQQGEETTKNLRGALQARMGGKPGASLSESAMLVDFGDELAAKVRETAEKKGMSADDYIRTACTLATEGDWV